MLRRGTFRFQTLDQARVLASTLAGGTPEPERVVTGLSELFVNAVEHGNLAIDYDTKSELQESGGWLDEINRRLELPEYSDRYATVEVEMRDESIGWKITDEGAGFDWQKYVELDPERAFDSHGRGIVMSKLMSFDRLHYEGPGNVAVAEIDVGAAVLA